MWLNGISKVTEINSQDEQVFFVNIHEMKVKWCKSKYKEINEYR